jgi:glycosyltransferase involved in cell wall biosynthesis
MEHRSFSPVGKNSPTVSIGLPVFDGENYLRTAIDSILSQTFEDFELVISDNASSDKTMEICRGYADQDSRVRYYRSEKNMGAAWNFNRVFQLARGEFFQWACHDDALMPTFLERCVGVLRQKREVVLSYSKTTWINECGQPTCSVVGRPDLHIKDPQQRFRLFLEYHDPPNECTPSLGLIRASVLEGSSLHGNYPSSDMILLAEILLRGQLYEIPEYLSLRRDHPLKSTIVHRTMEDLAIWFDPSQEGRIQLTTWRLVYEWTRTVLRSPIGVIDRTKCAMHICKWAWSNRRPMRRELRRGIRIKLRRGATRFRYRTA